MPIIVTLDDDDGRRLADNQYNIPPEDHGKIVGKYNGHQIRKRKMGNYYVYVLYDPINRRSDIKIEGRRFGKHFHLEKLNGRKDSEVKLYHLYVHLIVRHKLILYSDVRQTMPTVKTWEKLNQTNNIRLTHRDGKDRTNKLEMKSDWLQNYGELTRFTASYKRNYGKQ
jgi:hypothetical protein